MRNQHKLPLFMVGMTGLAGIALVAAGSMALFTSHATGNSDPFAVGTVQVTGWNGAGCTPPTTTSKTVSLGTDELYPGKNRMQTFSVENTGSLDEWVGVVAHLPVDVPVTVSYQIEVDTPETDDGSGSDPDANGDVNSNCHTGSKGRGAGGEDKAGDDQIVATYQSGVITTSDTAPKVPFELPVGYHAHITYTYQLASGKPDKSGPLTFDVWAVQYRNNVTVSGTTPGPISWAPQPAS